MENELDVIIVGAGLSGIGAAYHLQTSCPNKTYAILESRDTIGGTWDLFRYPGIRSDSDMYTLGYPFRPWRDPKAIADGPSILAYIRETAAEYGIDKKIRFQHKVERASWSSADQKWTLHVRDARTNELLRMTARVVYLCAGYYEYESGYTPEFAGRERFRGRIVHPQKWTSDIDYEGKRVVVIGSGATAVTLVPELAKKAKHVVMLQRSPTYIISVPAHDPIATWLRKRLSPERVYAISRWKNVFLGMGIYAASRRYPKQMKSFFVKQVRKHLGSDYDVETHFTPKYNPWDQRLCLVPDADLFASIKSGSASVVTDRIKTFTEKGIELESGREIEADLIVTATGLKLKFLGGVTFDIDGKPIDASHTLVYKGMMCSDVPNLAFAVGYTNASWTLKCDLASRYLCRVLDHMDKHGYTQFCPRRNDPSIEEIPLIDFNSGYVQRAVTDLPKQGSVAPWKLHQNYVLDLALLERARIDDGTMEFSRGPSKASRRGVEASV